MLRTVGFGWRRRRRRRSWLEAGVGHLQVPGLLFTGVFPEHQLCDGDPAGPLPATAAGRTGQDKTPHTSALQIPTILLSRNKTCNFNVVSSFQTSSVRLHNLQSQLLRLVFNLLPESEILSWSDTWEMCVCYRSPKYRKCKNTRTISNVHRNTTTSRIYWSFFPFGFVLIDPDVFRERGGGACELTFVFVWLLIKFNKGLFDVSLWLTVKMMDVMSLKMPQNETFNH